MNTLIKVFRTNFWVVCFALVSLLTVVNVKAQNNLESKQALSLVQRNAAAIGISNTHLKDVMISKAYHDPTLDADLIYLQQSYLGLPVFNSIKSIAFKADKVTSATGSFISTTANKAPKSANATVKPNEAILFAAKYVNLSAPQNKAAIKSEANGQKAEFDGLGISQENITTELMWVATSENQLELSWQVKIVPFKTSDYWLINVNAITGKVSGKINLTVNCSWDKDVEHEGEYLSENIEPNQFQKLAPPPAISSAAYRVLPFPIESPTYGSFSLVNDPWLLAGAGNNSGSLGWHNDGATEYNITRGNNVWSKEDRAGDNETTIGVSTTSSTAAPNYTFNDIFNPTTSVVGSANQKAAITNLFYWNNIVHDITYQYGFDEVSGNFQNDNQSRGGTGGDYVLADAQDGSGSNNANFNTPVDGSRPRMQMFLFSPSPNTALKINSPAGSAGFVQAYEVLVSANNKLNDVGPVTADLVLYDNSTNLGCTAAAANAFAGKIVLVGRGGSCNSQAKIKNSQNGGAVGVLLYMADASPAGTLTTTTDNTVTIPAVLMTLANAQAIASAMSAGTVNVTLSGSNLDGDFDNGVIVHEYGHGISNRLTGGPANVSCLQNKEQMGEGWSDYYGLMLTTNWATATTTDGPNKRPLGNYVIGQDATGGGIRRYPYTTNMTINPWTYGMMATGTTNQGVPGEVHLTGEIWAATLWDMTWNIIGIDGINTNLYNAGGAGGNSVSMKLVTQGMKLQPCSPGFLDGRDGILKADTLLYGGRYSCAIWTAFARRGMGKNAVEGSSNSVLDQTEDFTLPSFNYDTTVSICNIFTWYDTTIKVSGTYTHTYLLPGGCSRTITLHLTILSVSSTFTKTDAGCFGSATGSITVTPTSGVAPYTYRIGTTGVYGSSNTFINLKAGNYRVSILDANGCAGITAQITIGQQAAITGTFTKTDAGCFGSATGSLTVTPTTGFAPFTYRLGTSGTLGTSNSFTGLRAGSYTVYVKDVNGCIGSVKVTISQPPSMTQTFVITNTTCYGGTNGSIIATANGGTSPYLYKLGSSGAFSSNASFTGLRAGSYRIYVQDAGGCTFSSSAIVTQPSAVTLNLSKTDLTCINSNDGTITANGSGGTSPYQFKFGTGGSYSASNMFTNLKPGTFRVYIRDANNCGNISVVTTILQSTVPCAPTTLATRTANTKTENPFVLLSPNPSNGSFTLTTKADNNSLLEIRVIDVNGKIVYTTKGVSGQVFKFGDRFATGSFLIEITKNNQKQTLKAIKIK